MGKGDKKTKRGKIINKSSGKKRMRKKNKGYIPIPKASPDTEPIKEEPKATVKKSTAKKAAPKKKVADKPAVKKTPAKKTPAKKTTAKKEAESIDTKAK